jgi:hypothetical protein
MTESKLPNQLPPETRLAGVGRKIGGDTYQNRCCSLIGVIEMNQEKVVENVQQSEWQVLPIQLQAKILGKEGCFGDHEKINGNSAECQKCLLWTDCSKASLHQLLTVYDAIHCATREQK